MRTEDLLLGVALLLALAGAVLFIVQPLDEPADREPPETVTGVETVATDLDIPWGLAFLPDGDILVTERPGTLLRIDDGQTYEVDGVAHRGEGGLQGIALHPDFAQNQYIYLYMTTQTDDGLQNRVVRYQLTDTRLSNPETIIDGIPGASYHDGGRIAFGPDDKLYITTGDATQEQLAQDTDALAGKILRLNPDGSVPANNPFNSPVWSYGHRNPQGLTWDDAGRLWATEHGATGRDELNLIRPGENYGWPVIAGSQSQDGMQEPVIQSGSDTWAPAGAAYLDGSIYFAGLRGNALYQADVQGTDVLELSENFSGRFGRLRAVAVGPDGNLYVTTSNTDGRGNPDAEDDRVLRIDPAAFN